MSSMNLSRIQNDENLNSRLQNAARVKTLTGPSSIDVPRIRSALGELSNTIGKKKNTVERKQFSKLPVENLFQTKFCDKTARPSRVEPLKTEACQDSKDEKFSDIESFGEIESMPNFHGNEEEECEEFVWPKNERLLVSDLDFLCSWIPSKKPGIGDLNRINSSEETIDESMLISPESSSEFHQVPVSYEEDLFDSTIPEPVPLSDSDDDF